MKYLQLKLENKKLKDENEKLKQTIKIMQGTVSYTHLTLPTKALV